ncbi:choice-of-anchor Q domain-containing protein [Tautonia plasticadhaerens]|uniref:Uncharacterized protein n=1 Tax=Tautonia plasticadhaerens TaxID=2527974 RepID=A0A518H2H6_9BACT|nr:choice-of-anchor Q domain-containing protein [Tautonia plasticadhaerens]QDV35062.1 hypothetical protein ElP_29640 [Tautonia plasticadhaerens]
MEPRTLLATFTVTSLDDAGPGSLREAIERANMDPDPDAIDFAPGLGGTIELTTALPELATDVVLSGPGASALTLTGAPSARDLRGVTVAGGAEVRISGLTISGVGPGLPGSGGGIRNSGTLTLSGVSITGNVALGGGGISNEGVLTLIDSTVSGNTAEGFGSTGGSGGGISNSGTLTVINSTIAGNVARPGTIAQGFGGGISNGGTATIVDSLIAENGSSDLIGVVGGGVANSGTLLVSGSTLSGNSGDDGGGISIGPGATATFINSTISGNHARRSGGGVSNAGTLTATSSTFAGNSGDGGAVSNAGMLRLATSIFADPDGDTLVNAGGSVRSEGHNLFSDDPGTTLDPTDLINTDPLLGPLADNGGPTPTHALRPGSPAVDAAVPTAGVTTDQRGVPRPQGTAPDIGAFELVESAFLELTSETASNAVGRSQTVLATARDAMLAPLAAVPVTFRIAAGPNAGASGTTEPADGRTDADGRIRFTYPGVGGEGTDVLIASATLPEDADVMSGPVTIDWSGPPTVVGVRRLGFHARPTRLVVAFDAAMDPTRAEDPANYRLVAAGPDRRLGTADDRPLAVDAATYDEALRAVTLSPRRRLPLHGTYRLTVVGTPPGGLTSASGLPLDGAGTGRPGSDYEATFGREALVRPGAEATAERVAELRRRHQERREAPVQQHRAWLADRLALRAERQAALRNAREGLVGG